MVHLNDWILVMTENPSPPLLITVLISGAKWENFQSPACNSPSTSDAHAATGLPSLHDASSNRQGNCKGANSSPCGLPKGLAGSPQNDTVRSDFAVLLSNRLKILRNAAASAIITGGWIDPLVLGTDMVARDLMRLAPRLAAPALIVAHLAAFDLPSSAAQGPAQGLPEALQGPLAARLENVRVRYRGEELPLLDIVRRAVADEQLAAYRELRAEHGGTPEGQLNLAHWCRRQGMAEEESLHWKLLLSMAPGHPDAIRALGLRQYHGMLLTKAEIIQAKAQDEQAKVSAKRWAPQFKKWKHALEHGDDRQRADALRQLKLVNDPLALPALEEVFDVDDAQITLTLVETLQKMPGEQAAALLANIAVEADDEYAREQASTALNARPAYEFVPALLARLATPIELTVTESFKPGAPILSSYSAVSYTGRWDPVFYNKHRMSGDYTAADVAVWGPQVNQRTNVAVIGYEPARIEYDYVLTRESDDPDTPQEVAGKIVETGGPARRKRKVASIDELRETIEQANAETAARNKRLHAVLSRATKVDVVPRGAPRPQDGGDVDPRWWWDWWRRESTPNDYLADGTEVWTPLGPVPIEHILIGDRVLARTAQDELVFSLVLACDAKGEGAMHSFQLGGRTIVATPQQRLYVPGQGWKSAADLAPGTQVDSLTGAVSIDAVAPTDSISRHALVIADAAAYLIDRQGLVAHDATDR